MTADKIVVGGYCVNCAILRNGAGGCIVVDPGQEAGRIIAFLEKEGLEPKAILLTHGHFDHIGGIPGLVARFTHLPVYIHPADEPMLGHPANCNPLYELVRKPANLADIRSAPADLPEFRLEILETPGHTPGSVCIMSGDLLLSGDTLFAGSCGRTDFPGGSMAQMRKSLAALAQLPRGTRVLPGHGASTTIGRELDENPYMA